MRVPIPARRRRLGLGAPPWPRAAQRRRSGLSDGRFLGEITEQKELEDALRAAKIRFAEATEAVSVGIALFDADDRVREPP
jgi:PAS domain-containing protein